VRRAVILTTLTVLLLAITGITLARESTIGSARNSLTGSTVQDTTATAPGEPTATTVSESTYIADDESTERSEPTAVGVTEDSTEVEEPEVTEAQASGGKIENIGKPQSVGKPKGVDGESVGNDKAKEDDGEVKGEGGQEKVTLCHKGKNTIRVGEPAVAAHQSHEDSLGPCQTEEGTPEPPEETPGAAQNGDGGGGNGQQKVTLCHKGKTLTVGVPALTAHLRHGDTEGPCVGQ